jgi:hypothetical protein
MEFRRAFNEEPWQAFKRPRFTQAELDIVAGAVVAPHNG